MPQQNTTISRSTGEPAGTVGSEKQKRPQRKEILLTDTGPEVTCYECTVCGYVYDPLVGDPVGGIPTGDNFLLVPPDWLCPECGARRDQFTPVLL